MVIVFDLDDTLYDELSYVQSGFRTVAEYLLVNYQIPIQKSYDLMIQKLKTGRSRIFDDVLMHFEIYSKKAVLKCRSVYRLHLPEIKLYPEANACLNRFRKYPLYIVTDGNKIVQNNKLNALGLPARMKKCYITHRFGIRNAKPSPYCFELICRRENVPPDQVVYIADNPQKDFVGIKPLGFHTIRVLKGQYKNVVKTPKFEADYQIGSLDELTVEMLEKLMTYYYSR